MEEIELNWECPVLTAFRNLVEEPTPAPAHEWLARISKMRGITADALASNGVSMFLKRLAAEAPRRKLSCQEVRDAVESGVPRLTVLTQTPSDHIHGYADLEPRGPSRDVLLVWDNPGEAVYSSHYRKVPNVLGHLIFQDREDDDGNVWLHLVELQSDWHQQGARNGYTDDAASLRGFADLIHVGIEDTTKRVPNAPFKKSWHQILLKQAMWCLENLEPLDGAPDYAGMTLPSGEEVADLTSADKDTYTLEVKPSEDEIGYVGLDLHCGGDAFSPVALRKLSLEDVRDWLTRQPNLAEFADEILEAAQAVLSDGTAQEIELGDDGARILNHGVRRFYDSFLPREIAKCFGTGIPTARNEFGLVVQDHHPDLVHRPRTMRG